MESRTSNTLAGIILLIFLALFLLDIVQDWRSWEKQEACRQEKGWHASAHRKTFTTKIVCASW